MSDWIFENFYTLDAIMETWGQAGFLLLAFGLLSALIDRTRHHISSQMPSAKEQKVIDWLLNQLVVDDVLDKAGAEHYRPSGIPLNVLPRVLAEAALAIILLCCAGLLVSYEKLWLACAVGSYVVAPFVVLFVHISKHRYIEAH